MASPIDRRTFVAAICAAGVVPRAAAQSAAAPTAAPNRAKGPLVWLDMDQEALDEAYDQRVYAPNMQQLLARSATDSEAVRRRLGEPRRFSYGPTAVEALDVYVTNRPNAPVNVFVHGGAWLGGSAQDSAAPAELFVNAGAHYVAVDFASVADVGGSLLALVEQVRRAIAWVYRNAQSFGGDPQRLYLSGHSSGAHLAAVALVTDWQRDFGLPLDVIKGALCCSGMFDLDPVRLSFRRDYVHFSDEVDQQLSPQRVVAKLNCPLIVAYGTLESPEFQRQSRDFAAVARGAGKQVTSLVAEGYNHFEILETLANPYGLLGRAVLEQMAIA